MTPSPRTARCSTPGMRRRGPRSPVTRPAVVSPSPRCSRCATRDCRNPPRPSVSHRGPTSPSPPTRTSAARRPIPTSARAQAAESAADYLDGADPTNPLASPTLADLSGLAPVLVHASDCEVLTDDSVLLAAGIEAAGGDVVLELWPEMTHVWHVMAPLVPESRDAVDQVAAFLRGRFAA